MKLIETLIDLIVEAAPEQIYQKYYSDIDRNMFIRIISLDPATEVTNDQENGIKKIGKYSKLLLKMHKQGDLKPEDYPKAKDYLSLVYKHQVPIDINSIKNLGDLFTKVEKYYSQDQTRNVYDLINLLTSDEYELLLNGDKWLIYTPKSEKSAAYLGTGTEWCTAWGPYSTNQNYRDRKNHFSHHNSRGSLYVMINRGDQNNKYQFHFETEQFMDKNDRKINTGEFFEKNTEVTKYFYPSLYDDTPVDSGELDKMKFLSPNQVSILIERVVGQTDNPLITALINMDGDELVNELESKFINDDNIEELSYEYNDGGYLTIQFGDVSDGELQQCGQTSSYYRYDSDPYAEHSENLRSDITERDDEEWYEEEIGGLLKQYFDDTVVLDGVNDYETYRNLMNDYWEDLIGDFADEYAYLNEDAVRSASETELNNIERFIRIDDNFIGVPPSQLALFLHKEGIREITDMETLLGAYVSYHNLDFEYENPMWNMNLDYPKLNEMRSHFEGYTTKIEEMLNEQPECAADREELLNIRKKFFKGGNQFSREDLRIEIKGQYSCDTRTIPIIMNKLEKVDENTSNWKRYSGNVSLENLVTYVTNESLFERKN